LPGVDDGARNIDESLELCKMAVGDGIRHLTVTAHLHPGRWDNTIAATLPVFNRLQEMVTAEGLPLTLAIGGEVRLSAEVLGLCTEQQLPFIGRWQGKQLMLLELPHNGIPPGSDKLVAWLRARNILPMIAHPERNKSIAADVDRLHPFLEMGCLLQLTAMSVTRQFGERAYDAAHSIVERDWATVVASDAHNIKSRPPILSFAFDVVSERYGLGRAQRLFVDNPLAISGLV
jgi:protein-tyrosine phosphatase